MIPNIIYEESQVNLPRNLKECIELNIDCSETYPHLDIFKKYFDIGPFDINDYTIDKEKNEFTLRNCWMIQALGTMKLLDDIHSDVVLLKWKDKIEEFMDIITSTDFEYLIETNNHEDLDEIERKTEEIK